MCFFFLCVLIIFPISPPLSLASFIRMSAGDEKCNHETRRRDAARGNMFAVDKHTCRAFLARFSIVLDKPILDLHENTCLSFKVIWDVLWIIYL